MGKRFGSGGGGGGGSFSQTMRNVLRRRLNSFKQINSSTVDEIVHHLRSTYPDYHRLKLQTLTTFVHQTLDSSSPRRPNLKNRIHSRAPPLFFDDDDQDDDEGERSLSRKKPRRDVEESEERLQLIEKAHLRRIHGTDQDRPSTSDDESDSDDEDGAVSTSEEVDLMKSMLRESYMGPNSVEAKSKAAGKEKEKNLELELPGREKIGFSSEGGGGKRFQPESKREAKASSSVVADIEVQGNEGPRFRDLGGMKEVLEELEMEVLVPLYHPQLPRWLGVKPMAGILLHGPPGCGKTKLAHAIANETSVPFYKISATEIVSGVSGKYSYSSVYI